MAAQRKLTERVNGRLRIISNPPVVVPVRDLDLTQQLGVDPDEWMKGLLRHYVGTLQPDRRHLVEQYRVIDVAHKVVGVRSVGSRAWIVLLVGADDQDPLFLQAKEAQASVLARYTKASRYRNQGRRVVEGERLIQAYGDILLGWHQTRFAQVRRTTTSASYGTGRARRRSRNWTPAASPSTASCVQGRSHGLTPAPATE